MNLWRVLLSPIIGGIPIGITLIDTVGYIARVDGTSMQPLFNPDSTTDYVFLNRWSVNHGSVRRGDVISLISPKNPEHKIIKRVIGVQGDVLKTSSKKTPVVTVPKGYCWVEGDHVGHSMDSNHFGPVSLGLVTAKATAIVWPPHRWQKVKTEMRYERLPMNLLPLK